jgi:hypothetical protein
VNLEHELRALPIAFPPEPDLTRGVLERLERRRRRVWLVPVLAALAAVGALLAIPQTRAAILDFLRIGGEEIRRVDTQPRAPERPPQLGRSVTLDEAQAAVDFPLLVPDADAEAFLDRSIPEMVNLRWNGLLLQQWRGEQLPFVQKQAGPGSQIVSLLVRGAPGVWLTGARHEVVYRDAQGEVLSQTRRLAGDVLIWERDGITYRLEGARTRGQALAAARNLQRR